MDQQQPKNDEQNDEPKVAQKIEPKTEQKIEPKAAPILESKIPKTEKLKYLSFKYNKLSHQYAMNDFTPEISNGAILTQDLDRIAKVLRKYPYQKYYNDQLNMGISLVVLLIIFGIWLFFYIYGFVNFGMGVFLFLLWATGLVLILFLVLGLVWYYLFGWFQKGEFKALKKRGDCIRENLGKFKKSDFLFKKLDLEFEVGELAGWISIKFNPGFVDSVEKCGFVDREEGLRGNGRVLDEEKGNLNAKI